MIAVHTQSAVAGALKAPRGQGAGLPGAGHTLGPTPGHAVELVHGQDPGLYPLGHVPEGSAAVALGAVGHLRTLL